jgi:DNA-binding IclR family transcriptional regulator
MAEISKTADLTLSVMLKLAETGPLSPAEVAEAMGRNRTVIYRLLTTLHQRGFVVRRDGRFGLGPVLVRLADAIEPELRSAASDVMVRLSQSEQETVVLHGFDDREALVVHQVVSNAHVLQVEHKVGSRHPMELGSSGRAILAFADEAIVKLALASSSHPESLEQQLTSVRELGYCASQDELQLGVAGIAAPILTPDGIAAGSLSILVPTTRGASISDHAASVISAAGAVSRRLAEPDEPRAAPTPTVITTQSEG